MRTRSLPWAGAAALCLLASCGSDDPTVNPAPGRYTLSGHVQLVGYMVDAQGHFAGNRVVRDAEGVRVQLLNGTSASAEAPTHGGIYSFSGLLPGAYQTRTDVIPGVSDESAVFTIVASDLTAGDTLRLVAKGDLLPVPNPFTEETIVYFEIPETLEVALAVMTLSGDTVQTLLKAPRLPGVNQVLWDGLDRFGAPVPAGNYWVTFASGADQRAHLLFKRDPLLAAAAGAPALRKARRALLESKEPGRRGPGSP